MKANGRRRWRRWAKKTAARIRKLSGESPREVMKKVVWNPPDFYQGGWVALTDDTGKPPPLPSPPWSARSLVGMTMSARKRLAFWEAYVPFCLAEPMVGEEPPLSWRRRCMTAISHAQGLHEGYRLARAKYRIGERLRLCPGCFQCVPWTVLRDFCDGTGVLPAGPLVDLADPRNDPDHPLFKGGATRSVKR